MSKSRAGSDLKKNSPPSGLAPGGKAGEWSNGTVEMEKGMN